MYQRNERIRAAAGTGQLGVQRIPYRLAGSTRTILRFYYLQWDVTRAARGYYVFKRAKALKSWDGLPACYSAAPSLSVRWR
jgi:hypothetical protein